MAVREIKRISNFVGTLEELCSQGQSGVLHFTSTDEHAGHIMIRQGEIIMLRYYTQSGSSVLETLQSWTELSYHFTAKTVTRRRDHSLPTTDDILNRLSFCILQDFYINGSFG